jgi:hypothetical protein
MHDDQCPMSIECGGLATEQIHTPQTIFGVTDEGKPG